ncbi:hypothetical protein Dxin01_02763 [Deinococcus xinjiangensis]|uniref:Uncharacterized protein n=1 Tax=Deinococcus xinjiangensis TaxID=457454 RepID=A0ABP9VCP8_9DEIO
MTSLSTIREAMAQAKRANADFFFPEKAVWSDGIERRFKVSDPNREINTGPLRLNTDPIPASLRLVKFHPDSALPSAGASVISSNGLVVLSAYTDEGNLFGTRVGVCRLIDERLLPSPHWLFDHVAQFSRGEMDALLNMLSQQSRVAGGVPVPESGDDDTPVFGEVSLDGNVTLPASSQTDGEAAGQSESLQRYPAYARQIPAERRSRYGDLGADFSVPLWEVLVRRDAPLERTPIKLAVTGGHLPAPLYLEAVQDAEDVDTLGVVWRVLCRAPLER